MRFHLLSLLTSMLVGYVAEPPDLHEPPDLFVTSNTQDSAVGVWKGIHGGSGTVVACEDGKSLVLTNRHVVDNPGSASITVKDKTYAATVLAMDSKADLAILLVKAELPVVEIAESEPATGEPVRQWGRDWHGQGKPIFKTGKYIGVTAGVRTDGSAYTYETTIDSISGDSGCGIFDRTGRLVAVNWGRPNVGHGQLAVGLKDVVAFLKKETASHFPRFSKALAAHKAAGVMPDGKCDMPDCTCGCASGGPCTCKPNRVAVGEISKWELALYTTAGCKWCAVLEASLKRLNIPYHKYDTVAMPSYPVLGLYKDRKLVKYLNGNQDDNTLRELWDQHK